MCIYVFCLVLLCVFVLFCVLCAFIVHCGSSTPNEDIVRLWEWSSDISFAHIFVKFFNFCIVFLVLGLCYAFLIGIFGSHLVSC